jgi:hypothetical protein
VQVDQLPKAWEVGDVVRRYSPPAEEGSFGIILSQMGVISGIHKRVPQVSWYYKDEQGQDCWQNLEPVPLTQLAWFTLVNIEDGGQRDERSVSQGSDRRGSEVGKAAESGGYRES